MWDISCCMNKIFITGMMRSGTTLVQKSLNAHPEIELSYQSRTSKYIDLLRKLYSLIGVSKYHVLSHHSPNVDLNLNDINLWLTNNAILEDLFDSSESTYSGLKEVMCEEFVPYFLSKKVKCIVIVRDPRDVICSMSFGNGDKYVGLERPVLFDLKNWRKSALISYAYRESEYLLTIRLEDLILNTTEVMNRIYSFLCIDSIEYTEMIEIMNKIGWKSNSSFGERQLFDIKSIGNYKGNVPIEVIRYIETICRKEMNIFGYNSDSSSHCEEVIKSYSDPFNIFRSEFDSGYSSLPENISYEIKRSHMSIDELVDFELGIK